MSNAFVGEIRWFPYTRGAPTGWQLCDGSLLAIAANETLFSLIGTTYGGNGVDSFALPDLRGRVPAHQGRGPGLSDRVPGMVTGSETVTVLIGEMPGHSHLMQASTAAATQTTPAANVPAALTGDRLYVTSPAGHGAMLPAAIGPSGGNQSHENCAPTLPILPCIALQGIYPPRN